MADQSGHDVPHDKPRSWCRQSRRSSALFRRIRRFDCGGSYGHGQSALVKPPAAAFVRYYDVISADGTRLRAWTNDADGPRRALERSRHESARVARHCSSPTAEYASSRGTIAASAARRGRPTTGSISMRSSRTPWLSWTTPVSRPRRRQLVGGSHRCVRAGWSLSRARQRDPRRRRRPRQHVRHDAGADQGCLRSLPSSSWSAWRVWRGVSGRGDRPDHQAHPLDECHRQHAALVTADQPRADPGELRTLMQEFCTTHPSWYAKLALGVSEHQRVSLSSIAVPVTFLSGKWDMLTGARDMLSASKRVEGSRLSSWRRRTSSRSSSPSSCWTSSSLLARNA